LAIRVRLSHLEHGFDRSGDWDVAWLRILGGFFPNQKEVARPFHVAPSELQDLTNAAPGLDEYDQEGVQPRVSRGRLREQLLVLAGLETSIALGAPGDVTTTLPARRNGEATTMPFSMAQLNRWRNPATSPNVRWVSAGPLVDAGTSNAGTG
jgi:hypothetical protein